MKALALKPGLLIAVLALAAGSTGCGMDFDPASYLSDLRVLAIQADPMEVGPGEQVDLRPVIFLPEGQTIAEQTWTFCPFNLGAQAGYACAVPACEQTLEPAADGSLTSDPLALGLACAARFADEPLPAGIPTELPEVIEMTYALEVTASDGTQRQAIARIPVYPAGPPTVRNQPPVITRVDIGDQTAVAGELLAPVSEEDELQVRAMTDPASMDAYQDEYGRDLTEEAIVSFFATAGRFDYDRAAGVDVAVPWVASDLEDGQTRAEIYVVVRDLRGGQTVAGPFPVPILR